MKNLTRFDIALLFLLTLVIIVVGSILVSEKGANVPELLYSGIFIFSIQGIINLFLNRNIESYKNEMNKDNQNAIQALTLTLESFKSDLSLTLAKQSKLYEHRLTVVSDLYQKIINLHQKMSEMTVKMRIVSGTSAEIEADELKRIKDAGDSYNDFLNFYLRNKLYFSPDTCEKIGNIQNEYKGVFHDYTLSRRTGLPLSKSLIEQMSKTSDTVENVIAPILTQIESDFRQLLGIE